MSRPFRELVKDYDADPSQWEVIQIETEPSSNIRNQGGSSVQELLRHKTTGEEVVRHTLLRPDGQVFRPAHLRPQRK
jgi:hypothetical protein